MPQIDYLTDYRDSIQDAQNLISAAHSATGLASKQVETITESAFLRMFIAWEHFLESSLSGYVSGETSAKGTVVRTYAKAKNSDHAKNLLIGTQRYVDYANREVVVRLSELFLENGEPFKSVINQVRSDLDDLKILRNAAAHHTITTSAKLNAVASRKLLNSIVSPSVYRIIVAVPSNSASGNTILSEYLGILDASADLIVNY